jgi:DNA-binding IscR family transcriptional regulator
VALSIMYLVGRDYSAGKTAWSAHALAAELDIPSIALAPVLRCLEQNGLLLATEGEQFVPGRDIAAIRLAEIFEVVRALHSGRLAIAIHSVGPAVALLNQVEASMQEPLKSRTLKDFVETKF